MTAYPPDDLHGERRDSGMLGMLLLSAFLHGLVLAGALLLPATCWHQERRPVLSYSVELVSPDQIAGTNLVEGGRGRTRGQTMAAAPPAPANRPQAEKREELPSRTAEDQPKPNPRPNQEEPGEGMVAQIAKTTPPRTPTPTQTAVAVAQVAPSPTATRPPVDLQRLAQQTAAIAKTQRAAEEQRLAAEARRKAEEEARRKAEEEARRKAEEARKQAEAERKKAEEEARRRAEMEARKKAEEEARRKAEEQARERERQQFEAQILAATRRLQGQVGERGAGSGTRPGTQPGGPLSAGPGQGPGGGMLADPDYVLYLGQLQRRLQDNWAWAGKEESLEAVVAFSITPTGEVVNVRIVKSSGDRNFDLSVERTVRAINPMPPPPEKYRTVFGDVEFTFNAARMQP